MPRRYEQIRDSYVAQGKPLAEAKTLAAKTFNATRKPTERPVTGRYEKKRLVGGRTS